AEPTLEPGVGARPSSNGHAGSNGAEPPPPPPARPASSRRALKNWRVRSRLLLLITIPTPTAVALGAIRIASSVQSAPAYQRGLPLAHLSLDITPLPPPLLGEAAQPPCHNPPPPAAPR